MKRRIEIWQKGQWKLRSAKPRIERNAQFTEDFLFVGAAFGDDIRSGAENEIEVNSSLTNN